MAALIDSSSIIVCCGTGGVGKTSVSAAIAHAAATRGRRAVVITIDPARRLADAIGLRGNLENEPTLLPLSENVRGEMWAAMLDVHKTFDDLIDVCARTPEQARVIKSNPIYGNISGGISGTRDFMAAERLLALHKDDRFDLIVVDTPPSRSALDFLEAPERLTRLLEHRLYRLLVAPTRGGLRIVSTAVQPVFKLIGKVVGSDALSDVVNFLRAFDGMDEGFRARARETAALLRNKGAEFILVTSARDEALEESRFFSNELQRLSIRVGAVVANRMPPRFGSMTPTDAHQHAGNAGSPPMAWLYENLAQLHAEADRAESAIAAFTAGSTVPVDTPLLRVSELADDIHDLAGITSISHSLCQ